MPEAVHNADQEFWRPPAQQAHPDLNVPVRTQMESCARCSTEFAVGARFCHVCGAAREPQELTAEPSIFRFLDFRLISTTLGLSTASLVAFIIGMSCVLAAILTGVVFSAATVLDWQAVQIWRVEWLLGALAAFVAGILLKR